MNWIMVRVNERIIDWLIEWLNDWMIEWLNDWMPILFYSILYSIPLYQTNNDDAVDSSEIDVHTIYM